MRVRHVCARDDAFAGIWDHDSAERKRILKFDESNIAYREHNCYTVLYSIAFWYLEVAMRLSTRCRLQHTHPISLVSPPPPHKGNYSSPTLSHSSSQAYKLVRTKACAWFSPFQSKSTIHVPPRCSSSTGSVALADTMHSPRIYAVPIFYTVEHSYQAASPRT